MEEGLLQNKDNETREPAGFNDGHTSCDKQPENMRDIGFRLSKLPLITSGLVPLPTLDRNGATQSPSSD